MTLRLRNFTPHKTLTYVGGSEPVVLPAEGLARCRETSWIDGAWDDDGTLPRTRVSYGAVTGLPEPEAGTIYVVSQLVVTHTPERADLAFPFDLVRDDEGSITGFRALATLGEGHNGE